MAFESLSNKLQEAFKKLRGKGRLTEADVREAMKEIKTALLEADVNFRIVKKFIRDTEEKAIGRDVLESLSPAQTVIKIVHEELVQMMGGEPAELVLKPAGQINVIMMVGLQGAGKTTTAAKLGGKFKSKGRKVLLAACDTYRPAAIEQLQINGEKLGLPVFAEDPSTGAVEIAYNNAGLIPVVLDNHITGMTGHQDNPGSGYNLRGEVANAVSIEDVLRGCGYKNIIIVDPQDLKAVERPRTRLSPP